MTTSLFLITTLVFCVSIWRSVYEIRSINSKKPDLLGRHEQLTEVIDFWEVESGRFADDKRVLTEVLSQCRSVQDIPSFGGTHAIFHRRANSPLRMYVPDGKHTLVIRYTRWDSHHFVPKKKPRVNKSTYRSWPVEEKSWEVSLLPNCGYQFVIRHGQDHQKPTKVAWELISNDPQFETRSEQVLTDPFVYLSNSSKKCESVLHPSQLSPQAVLFSEYQEHELPGTKLFSNQLTGTAGDGTEVQLWFEIRLISEASACVSALDAIVFFQQGKNHMLMPYQGSGKYVVTAPPLDKASDK